MSICDNCIHLKVCGHEGVEDEAMTYCADALIKIRKTLEDRPHDTMSGVFMASPIEVVKMGEPFWLVPMKYRKDKKNESN